jgi:hypothetical protein
MNPAAPVTNTRRPMIVTAGPPAFRLHQGANVGASRFHIYPSKSALYSGLDQ